MYINRALLLVAGMVLLFYPAIEDWVIGSEPEWYRPYQLWFLVVLAAYWNQRTRRSDEL